MSVLAVKWKTPRVTYGTGETKLSHINDEWISLEEVERSAETIPEALLNLELHNVSSH